MPSALSEIYGHIFNEKICCPVCDKPLKILGTVVYSENPKGYVGECRELTCMTLVHFHIVISNVIAPSRLIKKIKELNDE
ncbi:hypothetical protein [Acinetobacter sp. ANC 4648]|uniref:hypothetical protein n=1 Tax=Acinetobacter sp. ANC 4648 TaxID=1977875 RepID=UPI000A34F4B5|nr:hypothetical protein [Acinetobacter sp. ANC 4648]OTG83554.1 hypothetical protein B9T27_03285 [Acinetobacter sp. ANC 4648]